MQTLTSWSSATHRGVRILLILWPLWTLAQTPPQEKESREEAAPAVAAQPPAPPAPKPPVETCAQVTDLAGTADLKAATAQSQKLELTEQVKLYEEAVSLWARAGALCNDRALARAQRNMADNQKVLLTLREQMGSGPLCAAAHKDATALQDLGRQALGQKQWAEATVLFRKAENMWDLATERCTGSQQDVATRRREQSEIDGHNAEHCAPLFEKARERTQKTRASAATLTREEKQEALMQAETLWRDSLGQCKGPVLDTVRNNIQTVARERGTPWVPPKNTVAANTSVKVTASPAAVQNLQVVSKTSPTSPPVAAALVSTSPPVAPAPQVKPPEAVAMPPEFMAGSTKFMGSFVRDAESPTYSGNGKVTWENGDVFDGTMRMGIRTQGQLVWANGQRYSGEWTGDKPTGKGQMQFTSGNHYEGQVVNGVPHGRGSMRYASGDNYSGSFVQGEPQGHGSYHWKNQQAFEGEWLAGKPHGKGKLRFANGDVYEGAITQGLINGQGVMHFADLSHYTGHFVNGVPDGNGTFVWPTGEKYEGEWKAGKKHGKGHFTWKTGQQWVGRYDNDEQAEGSVKN